MTETKQETVFAFDLGATNWRLYRVEYRVDSGDVHMLGDPQPSPLTSFVNRRLPADILMNSDGSDLESFGEVAQLGLEDEKIRECVREYFKPCIGSHLEPDPLPHQKRYTHTQALRYTGLMLTAVLAQLRQEKWRGQKFDERVRFSFAYPVHWNLDHGGKVFQDFRDTVLDCFNEDQRERVRFVMEPEGAILSLQLHGLLERDKQRGATLIVDVGGSTTDMIAGRLDHKTGQLEFLRRYGEVHGGGLYDAEIAKYIADELKIPASALSDDPYSMIPLRVFARQLKESLSRMLMRPGGVIRTPQRTITLVLRDGEIYRRLVKLDIETFKGINRHIIADFEHLIDSGLRVMDLKPDDFNRVILVGGGAQLFTVVNFLRERFKKESVVLADNPEEIVVQGVALEYGRSFERSHQQIIFTQDSPTQADLISVRREIWELVDPDGKKFPILGDVATIGRRRTNQIWLKDDLVSRIHAEVRIKLGALELIDLGSTNGTYLNGERINPKETYILSPGDEIKIGRKTLVVTRPD